MRAFVFCCLLLFLVAGATATDNDIGNIAEEIRDILVDKKADTEDVDIDQDASDDEKEKKEIDLRIIQDLLSGDEDGLALDIDDRMAVNFRRLMRRSFEPKLREIVESALVGADVKIRDKLNEVATDSGINNFFCRFQRSGPRFVRQLNRLLFVLDKTRELVENGCH